MLDSSNVTTSPTSATCFAAVVRQFPDLSPAQLSEFLQVAQAQAERRAARPH